MTKKERVLEILKAYVAVTECDIIIHDPDRIIDAVITDLKGIQKDLVNFGG